MKRTYLTLIIMMLLIGFAAVSANLVLSGTLKIGSNTDEFEKGVVFTRTNTMHGDATIDAEGKTITFTTTVLKDLKEQAILDYDITNKSLEYDADVSMNCNLVDESYKEYIELENSEDLNKFKLESGSTKTGRLTITLKKTYVKENESIAFKCSISANAVERTSKGEYIPKEVEYEEILLNGADPVLEASPVEAVSLEADESNKKLIPVTISEKDGTVTRADTTKEWYDYETKKWANAVILNDGVEEPKVGSEIEEDKIESYFVWIPKYRYRLWNVNTTNPTHTGPFTIEIEFGTEDTTDVEGVSCATPLNEKKTQAVSGESANCNNGEWMTHPAFITMGVDGFWVGKFEVGYKQNDDLSTTSSWTKSGAEIDEENSTKVIVKPNVYSWRNMTNKKMFNSLKGYATNLDSHMMKNTEWGAVAYLSHSKYGINNEVAQNTNKDYLTGYVQVSENNLVPYPSQNGVIASTTGNITGIYDMSGGVWEITAAYRDVANTTDAIGLSGFTKTDVTSIGEKYFDVYDKESINTFYEKRILGDATGEMGPFSNYISSWYTDSANFVGSGYPWFHRGGDSNDSSGGAGQFTFFGTNGGSNRCSRLVLAPQ